MSLDSLKQEASNHNTSPQRLRELAAINDELARLVAANPLADCNLLEELAINARTNKDVEMQRAIASNPNTPTQSLVRLAYLFPEDFFSNPAYDLLTLETVNFSNLFSTGILVKLAFASNAPASFLEFAASIAEASLQRLRNAKEFPYVSLERQHEINIKRLPKDIGCWQGRLYFQEFWSWRDFLIRIACHQNFSKKKLFELSASGEDIVSELAQVRFDFPNNDINFWDKVASYKQPKLILFIPHILIFRLVQLPDISTTVLKAASQINASTSIHNIIANHPKTPKVALDKLTESSVPFVAEAAKLHINYAGELETGWCAQAESKIDRAQLPSLTNEEGIELRLWRAGGIHESTLPYLNQNSVYADKSTLLKIVCSADTPETILDNLENHPRVSQLITECIAYLKQQEAIVFDLLPRTLPIDNTKLSEQFAHGINTVVTDLGTLLAKLEDRYWCRKKIFLSIKAPVIHVCLVDLIQRGWCSRYRKYHLHEMLSNFDRGRYKKYSPIFMIVSNLEYYGVILASDPSTSPQILSKLVEHPIRGVRVLVASHHNISQNSLNKLIDDRNSEVRAAVFANPKLDAMLKKKLANLENQNLSAVDLLELANSKYTAVRAKVARHRNVDSSILAKLADDKLIVRLAVARHPKTPVDILTRFTKHPERKLHLAVAQNPGTPTDLLIKLATQPAKCGGFHFNPLNLAAVKSLLIQEPDAAVPLLERCLKFPAQPSFSRFLVLMNPHIPNSFLAR